VTFHEGELAVQRRAGLERRAARLAGNIADFIPPAYGPFLETLPFVVLAARDRRGRMWASWLAGVPGFATVLDDRRLRLAAALPDADPLAGTLAGETPVGILAIEPVSRTRARLNGIAQPTADGLVVTVAEAFANCPKQIRRRVPAGALDGSRPASRRGAALTPAQRDLVAVADTFFTASAHPSRGADASHRGGPPGFVAVSADRLRFPDYAGNGMFQTLGNLAVDPSIGLLFADWETGTTVQLTGRARIVWEPERVVEVEVAEVVEREHALRERWATVM
jgi:predicted pyridoxine 5'-phosphate oxidase superfamily flavin-nucleotide-binding protein